MNNRTITLLDETNSLFLLSTNNEPMFREYLKSVQWTRFNFWTKETNVYSVVDFAELKVYGMVAKYTSVSGFSIIEC